MRRGRKGAAILTAAALLLSAPGLEAYRVFAQEVIRPQIPISPAGGFGGAAGAGVQTGQGANPSLPTGLGLPTPVITASPRTVTTVALNTSLSGGGSVSASVAGPARSNAKPSALSAGTPAGAAPTPGAVGSGASFRIASGGGLMRRLLWRDGAAAKPAEPRVGAAEPTALGRSVERLSKPALEVPEGGSTEGLSQRADSDFAERLDGRSEAAVDELVSPSDGRIEPLQGRSRPGAALEKPGIAAKHYGTLVVEGPGKSSPLEIQPVRPHPGLMRPESPLGQDVHHRSVLAPAAAAAIAATAWVAAVAIPTALAWAGSAVGAQAAVQAVQQAGPVATALHAVWTAVSYGTFGVAAALATYAILDVALFATTVWAGRRVSEDQFHGAVRGALREMGLGPAAVAGLAGLAGHLPGRGVIHAYRGGDLKTRLSFGFTTPHGVYLRPELARFPWALRLVLRHELYHYRQNRARGPPEPPAERGFFRSVAKEFGSRIQELFVGNWLAELKISVLERVLREAQVSMSLPYAYGVVVVKPEAGTLRDSAELRALSGGKANVSEVDGLAALDAQAEPARLIVTPGASGWLPRGDTEASRRQVARLERALKQLDEQYLLSKGLNPTGAASKNAAWRELEELARKGRKPDERDAERLQRVLSALWRQVSSTQLKDLEVIGAITRLYGRLQDRGVLFLPFAPDEPGVDVLFRLLKYWEGPDGGRLQVERLNLPEGGHVLVARKLESRVNLWLKPLGDRRLSTSTTNISRDPSKAHRAEQVLREAGFSDAQLAEFAAAGVEVRHAFGADVGENRIFISAPKRKAKFLKRYAEKAGASIDASRGGYKVHLHHSGPLHNLPRTWRLQVQGEGMRIFDIDTGIDLSHPAFSGLINSMAENALEDSPDLSGPGGTPLPRVSSYDVTGEGDEDPSGHGTHKASISYGKWGVYTGMAPKAEGRMGKVFTRDGFGASDGDIMAAAAEAMKWGADVISLSLGTLGYTGDPLSVFFSNLAEQENSKGHKPIITASMGNSGPSNRTGSQPAAGKNVISVAAMNKQLGVSFFSSVGFARDTRFHLPRWLLTPSFGGSGGDVTAKGDSKDVYQKGIEAAKSKSMEPSPSDTPSRQETRMSGTSMSNPMIAGIIALVKQVALKFADPGSESRAFLLQELPFAMKVILQSSSKDLGVPVSFQGAGFVDAFEAARLAAKSVGGPDIEPAGGWRRLLRLPGRLRAVLKPKAEASDEKPWDWIARAKAIGDIEEAVYLASEKAYGDAVKEAQSKAAAQDHPEAPREEPPSASDVGNAGNAAAQRAFNAARNVAAPTLVEALKDPVWLVRFYAAMSLYNMRIPGAALELAKVAVGDGDGRVRQAAFLALAVTPSYVADPLLKQAAQETRADRVDVAIYSAYALARHGDGAYVARILQETTNADKAVRFTATWLIGELGSKAGRPGSDALASRLRDLKEDDNIRHLASAALGELANADPGIITDEAIVALLDSSGGQDLGLTRTISKFFSGASRKRSLVERMRSEPLKPRVMQFILANKAWVGRPGALGEMVTLLARIAGVPLDVPSPAPDPQGTGVAGVDPNLGPVHLIVEAPQGLRIQKFEDLRRLSLPKASEAAAGHGLDPQTLARHEALVQVAMPQSQSFWINVPDSKVAAFTADFEAKGYKVHRSRPKYRMIHETGPLAGAPELREKLALTGKGVLVVYLDEGGDLSHPGIAKERVLAARNFSGEGADDDVTQEGIGHGTHGMGIVGARAVDGSPYVGMAPDANFAIFKVLGANGGSDAMVMAGLEAALTVADPLKVPVIVNMSLGGPGEPDSPLSRLVNTLQLKDVAVAAAAGNEGPQDGTVGSPGNAALAFRVGAVDKKGKLTVYSSRDAPGAKPLFFWLHYGGAVDFQLPNPYEIISTLATNLAEKLRDAASTVLWKDKALYQAMSGTSMATPHVTGQLAQLAQRMAEVMQKDGGSLPHGHWLWLGKLINSTLQSVPDLKTHEGSGLFDARAAAKALEEALKDPKRVRAEAEALAKDAEARFGGGKPSRGGFWLRPARGVGLFARWLAPSMTGFTFSADRLAEPVEKLLQGKEPPRGPPLADSGAALKDSPSPAGSGGRRDGFLKDSPGLSGPGA